MKANRKTMLGVALAVAVIALAGIGYATYQGTASSSGNQIKTEFVHIELEKTTGDGTFEEGKNVYTGQTLAVEFDSVNTNGTIAYTLNAASANKRMVIDVDVGGNNTSKTYNLTIAVPTVSEPGVTGTWKYMIGSTEYTANAGVITVPEKTADNLDGELILTLAANSLAGTPTDTITINAISFTVVSTS